MLMLSNCLFEIDFVATDAAVAADQLLLPLHYFDFDSDECDYDDVMFVLLLLLPI